jgi:HJR/Mrr/RecB family endonuclease
VSRAEQTVVSELEALRHFESSLRAQCESQGAFAITPEYVQATEQAIHQLRARIRAESRPPWIALPRWLTKVLYLGRIVVREWSLKSGLPELLIALFSTVVVVVLILVLAAIVKAPAGAAIAAAAVAGVLWFGLTSLAIGRLDPAQCRADLRVIADEDRHYRSRLAPLEEKLQTLIQQTKEFRPLIALRDKYDDVALRLAQAEAAHRDLRNRLLFRGWRDLRGVMFEDFLQEVLVANGYTVERTPKTGDRGIDLIALKGNVRIAVQAKGYAGNVGNDAIQQAYTGMAIYRCQRCVVITNSDFTRQAREDAAHVGCQLIDGAAIPDLIRGDLL